VNKKGPAMAESDFTGDSNSVAQWLKEKGYSDVEVQKILVKLAEHDHQTLSDAVFDSIGAGGQTLDQLIRDALAE
jgi:hypothetical protein